MFNHEPDDHSILKVELLQREIAWRGEHVGSKSSTSRRQCLDQNAEHRITVRLLKKHYGFIDYVK